MAVPVAYTPIDPRTHAFVAPTTLIKSQAQVLKEFGIPMMK